MTSPKIEITDEMVERAYKRATGCWGGVKNEDTRSEIRNILEAALNPPAEPEIPVSEGMLDAAFDVFLKHRADDEGPVDFAVRAYRAMESQRRKEQQSLAKYSRTLNGAEYLAPDQRSGRDRRTP